MMETNAKETQPLALLPKYNRWVYGAFLLVGIIFLILKDVNQAVVFFGLALVFDPFDTNQMWNDRPIYQKIWLFAHLGATAALFGFMLAK